MPSFQELLHPGPEEDNTTGAFQLLLARYYRSRILFRTKRVYIGLGPERLQPRDEVWLFAKARTPFILRQRVGTALKEKLRICSLGHGICKRVNRHLRGMLNIGHLLGRLTFMGL